MRRALVISVLVHTAVFFTVFEFRLLPSYDAPLSNGVGPLRVEFASVKASGNLALVQLHEVPTATVAMEREQRLGASSSTAVLRRPVGEPLHPVARMERRLSPEIDQAEGLNGLPMDVETEYRLSLAREVRRGSGLSDRQRRESGLEGIVRLVISYRAGLPKPVVSLDRSSGYSELDELAMSSLTAALARVQLPGTATGIGFRMRFVLEYRQVQ